MCLKATVTIHDPSFTAETKAYLGHKKRKATAPVSDEDEFLFVLLTPHDPKIMPGVVIIFAAARKTKVYNGK